MFRVRPARALAIASALLFVVVSCGDDDGGPGNLGSNGGTAASGQGSGDSGQGADDATTTSTEPPIEDAFDFIAQFEVDPVEPSSTTSIGTIDPVAAAAITAEMAAEGVDLTGLEFWVFDVVGTADRLLVLEADVSAGEAASDPTEGDFFGILRSSPTVAEAGLTRFVLNYRDTDAAGDYVLTLTIPMAELLTLDPDGDITPFTEVQLTRPQAAG